MTERLYTVLELIEKHDKLETEVNELSYAIKSIRGKDAFEGIEQDPRKSVKLLYKEYQFSENALKEFNTIMFKKIEPTSVY